MRQHVRATLAAVALCTTAWACSGSDDSSAADPGATGSADPSTAQSAADGGSGSATAPGPGSTPSSPTPGAGSSPDGGAGSDSGALPGSGKPPGTSAGTDICPAGSPTETESNDAPETANPIPAVTSAFCGTLPSVSDVDYFRFTLPADAKTIYFAKAWDKAVTGVDVTVDGATFSVGSTPAFKPGKEYMIKVFIKGPGTATAYVVNVAITR